LPLRRPVILKLPKILTAPSSARSLARLRVIFMPLAGYTTPEEIQDLFEFLSGLKGAKDITLSTHCHNDLGLAVANSLAALRGGARQIEGALNGIGERAGNSAIEEVIMALKTRQDFFNAHMNVKTENIYAASKLLATITGNPVPRNKAIVGKNAFAHESGIHQHGVLANRETYEIMKPEDIGISEDNIILGKHSRTPATPRKLYGAIRK